MYRNYFTVALRGLVKHKAFSLINIAGLALGIASSLLIFLWVRDERSIDSFHENRSRLYTVYETQTIDGKVDGGYYTPGLLADEMKKTIPEIALATGFNSGDTHTFAAGDKIIRETGGNAGPDFFRMFSYPLLEGNSEDALSAPGHIAISREMAVAFFGSAANAMGKTLRYENKWDCTVAAVFDNRSALASAKLEYVMTWATLLRENDWMLNWGNNGPHTYLLLRPDANAALLEKKISRFLDAYNKEQDKNFQIRLGLQPFSEMYLHSRFENGRPAGGRIAYVRLFNLVAVIILIIACINFMNLTTARSMNRAREIGVRKALGAARSILIRQFLGEAMLTAVLSTLLALILVAALLPSFNLLTGKALSLPFASYSFWIITGTLVLGTGLFSGSYPALFLSSFSPIRVLKGKDIQGAGGGALLFRKGLVVFQFALSIVLIIATLLIARQVAYVQNANLGYEKKNLLYVPIDGDLFLPGRLDLFSEEARQLPGISSVCPLSQSGTTDIDNGTGGVMWTGKDPSSSVQFTHLAVGYDFTKTMKLALVAGRDYSRSFPTDSVGYILNESALKLTGYKDPVGKPLSFWGKPGTIIGIVKDFHFRSLHSPILPLVIRMGRDRSFRALLVRTEPGKTRQALDGLRKLCRQLNPAFPFTYTFTDDDYARLYRSEEVLRKLSVIFAILAIFISCLGLLGLSMFTAEQRTKEIGIRKVLGAGVFSLCQLLAKDFLLLVGIAFLIAAPVAWIGIQQWLRQFEYRTNTPWWIFGASGLLALLIALVTISFQTLQSARANPVASLRSE